MSELSVLSAKTVYDECAAQLRPERVLLHLGDADAELFAKNPADFAAAYIDLIRHIKSASPDCSVTVVSLKNDENSPSAAEMNRRLRYIAESEHCSFGDISGKQVWNPKEMREVISFVYSLGFVRPLAHKKPDENLVKILFMYKNDCRETVVTRSEAAAPHAAFGVKPKAVAI